LRTRTLVITATTACGLLLAGCSSSTTPAASATSASSAAATPSQPTPTDSAPTAAVTALANCSGSDNGIKLGFAAWQTLMKSDTGFLKLAGDTSPFASTVSAAASTDSTFGDTAGAAAATALTAALIRVESDLEQGDQTGSAPSSYPDDVKAAIAAEAPFEACQ